MSPLFNQRKRDDSPTKEEYEAILDDVQAQIEMMEDQGCAPGMDLLWRRSALQEKLRGFENFRKMKESLNPPDIQ